LSSGQKRKSESTSDVVQPTKKVAPTPIEHISKPAITTSATTTTTTTTTTVSPPAVEKSSKSGFKPLQEVTGDLFSADFAAFNLAHCISADTRFFIY
jgi:hypothetical protein